MILVFISLGIIIFLICILLLSTIRIEVKDLKASNVTQNKKTMYTLKLSLYFFNKLKWLSISWNEKQISKFVSKVQVKIDIKKVEKDFKLSDIKTLEKLNLKLSKFYFDAHLGLKSPITTSYLVAGIASIISILLPHFIKNYSNKNYYYKLEPIYQMKNIYKIHFNCIIELKMVHIINVIYILGKKGRSDENERTASHRKSYGYSYEQH